MSGTAQLTRRQANTNAWFAYSGAIVAQTGVQLIAPSLPVMRDALGLSDAQLSLVMSVYLLPAALGAIPAGVLADRIGRRRVFGWAMVIFGIAGIALQMSTSSFGLFLSIRFVQGLAFAGLLPLTMTILGDAYRGADLIRSQGKRSVAMLTGDGTLPIIGGVLAAMTWQTPWLGQLLAIPFGLAVLFKMTDPPSLKAATRRIASIADFTRIFKMPGVVAVQYAGFLRMFLKFSILTFLPVLFVDVRGFSPAFAGL
ncbi:MAG: MFS transporter, partial [Acidimicrobiia bacterium]|nr:MFS transporter [Acidimicrobiia bacterium]